MAKIPFTVSARAARLIGRENVATSQGAITELVKNAYDADSKVCVILFLQRHADIPATLSGRELAEVLAVFPGASEFYELDDGHHKLSDAITPDDALMLREKFKGILDLWIVDNGNGMSEQIIEENWMVIGTDTKEIQDKSLGGRVVTGAKGIGRFALDRLGHECELYSAQANSDSLAHWIVDWGDFEGSGKVITEVEAILEVERLRLGDVYKKHALTDILPEKTPSRAECGNDIDYSNGTAIRISVLHDRWDERDSLRLKDTLEALLPPKDQGDFNIYIYDHRAPKDSGFIDNFPPDQFDYRLEAKIDDEGEISIELTRQEIEADKINPILFELDAMKTQGFRREDFDRGSIEYKTDLRKILKLADEQDISDYLAIGPFSFTLYFFKLTNANASTLERFPQKHFNAGARRNWLANSGGVRLYRDDFRVRPYGEPNSQGSDWLLLGQRVAANPAQASRIGWRVGPQSVAGTIRITKTKNPLLSDQSNREGIMNERAFAAFRAIILGLIGEFEYDRAYIFAQFLKAWELLNPEKVDVDEGKKLADEALKTEDNQLTEEDGGGGDKPEEGADVSADDANNCTKNEKAKSRKIAKALKSIEKENEELKDDMQVMRGLATLGTVLVSFTHELKQIKANMESRSDRLEASLGPVINKDALESVHPATNPYNILARWNREDEKVSRWINFALSSISPSKRRRASISPDKYLMALGVYWNDFLATKKIKLHVSSNIGASRTMLAHEVDLDSVFYNLIANSLEALTRPSKSTERDIWITTTALEEEVEIIYRDNGPGLSSTLNIAEDIFMFGVSSKSNDSNADFGGTGLGMWLLKGIVDDYKGRVTILSALGEPHFRLSITLPLQPAKES